MLTMIKHIQNGIANILFILNQFNIFVSFLRVNLRGANDG